MIHREMELPLRRRVVFIVVTLLPLTAVMLVVAEVAFRVHSAFAFRQSLREAFENPRVVEPGSDATLGDVHGLRDRVGSEVRLDRKPAGKRGEERKSDDDGANLHGDPRLAQLPDHLNAC